METLAPPKLAESWDNVGLMLGSQNSDINKIVLFSKLATSAHSPFNYPVQTKPIQIIWDNNVNASPTFTHDPTPKKNLDNMFLETLHTQKK